MAAQGKCCLIQNDYDPAMSGPTRSIPNDSGQVSGRFEDAPNFVHGYRHKGFNKPHGIALAMVYLAENLCKSSGAPAGAIPKPTLGGVAREAIKNRRCPVLPFPNVVARAPNGGGRRTRQVDRHGGMSGRRSQTRAHGSMSCS
jgi:hypothetical protein